MAFFIISLINVRSIGTQSDAFAGNPNTLWNYLATWPMACQEFASKKQSSIILIAGANVMQLFTAIIYEFL